MDRLAAVIGATGQTGKHIVRKLLEQGIPVRILSRNLSKAKKMFGDKAEIIEGDLIEVKELNNLIQNATHLFAAHGADNEQSEKGYELIDFGGMEKALNSIPQGQKTHVIYMSSIYVERSNPPADFPGRPLYWKRRTENLISESGHPYTIVRASWLNNNQGGKMRIVAEQGDQGDGKITREDVAEVMIQAMYNHSAQEKIFEIYNVLGAPVKNWDSFFAELKTKQTIF